MDIEQAKKIIKSKASRDEKKVAWETIKDVRMNPFKDFNPKTFDPIPDGPEGDIGKRRRKEPPRRLPTMGMHPKEIDEGQMIGMYESKQDLYLLIAWLSHRISDLEDKST